MDMNDKIINPIEIEKEIHDLLMLIEIKIFQDSFSVKKFKIESLTEEYRSRTT